MTKPFGGAGAVMPASEPNYPFSIRSRRTVDGVEIDAVDTVDAMGAQRQKDRRCWIDNWPDGWCAQFCDDCGGAMIAEALPSKVDAIDAMITFILENGGTGFIADVPPSERCAK